MGLKVRCNWDVQEDEQKYYYALPCPTSKTLYGYCQNYEHLCNNTVYIVESEKSVMQAYSYGYRNFVATCGVGLSTQQCTLLMQLTPKKVVFLYDEGLDFDIIQRNIQKLSFYTKLFDIKLGYWDSTIDIDTPVKCSPTDLSQEMLDEILNKQILYNTKE